MGFALDHRVRCVDVQLSSQCLLRRACEANLCCPPLLLLMYVSVWSRSIALVAFAFVALYSYLPHKELRFVIYSVPLWNLISAVGLVRLYASLAPLPNAFSASSLTQRLVCTGITTSIRAACTSWRQSAPWACYSSASWPAPDSSTCPPTTTLRATPSSFCTRCRGINPVRPLCSAPTRLLSRRS